MQSVVDLQSNLMLPERVQLTRSRLIVDGRAAALSPGMSAQVEVVTGRRRVIDYLWSPVAKAVSEAGRER